MNSIVLNLRMEGSHSSSFGSSNLASPSGFLELEVPIEGHVGNTNRVLRDSQLIVERRGFAVCVPEGLDLACEGMLCPFLGNSRGVLLGHVLLLPFRLVARGLAAIEAFFCKGSLVVSTCTTISSAGVETKKEE